MASPISLSEWVSPSRSSTPLSEQHQFPEFKYFWAWYLTDILSCSSPLIHNIGPKKENRGSEKLSCLCSQASKWLSMDFNSDLGVPEPEMLTTCLYHFSGEAVWQGWIYAGNLQLWQSSQRWPWTWFLYDSAQGYGDSESFHYTYTSHIHTHAYSHLII